MTVNKNDIKAIILLSGGLDSVVSLSEIYSQIGNNILAITFDYGQRALKKELSAAKRVVEYYNIRQEVIEIKFLKEMLKDSFNNVEKFDETKIDDKLYTEQSAKRVWIPNRNALFLNIAASMADRYKIPTIVFGANKEEGMTFPDNSQEFIDLQNKVFEYSTQSRPKILAPMANYTKEQIVEVGLKMKTPLKYIFSCYNSKTQKHCGKCESCQRLLRALKINNQHDLINQIFD